MDEVYIKVEDVLGLKGVFNREYVSVEDLVDKIDELKDDAELAKQELEEYKIFVEENFRQITPMEEFGFREEEFH